MAGKYEEIVRCSFCNKPQSQVRKMIAGPNGVFICDQCVDVCTEIIEDELGYEEENAYDDINLLKPEEIKAFLDDYVIGPAMTGFLLLSKSCRSRKRSRKIWISMLSVRNAQK